MIDLLVTKYQIMAMLWWLIANTQPKETPTWFNSFLRLLAAAYFVGAIVLSLK